MSSDISSCNGFLSDIKSLLFMSICGLPEWIGKHRRDKIFQLSNDVYKIYKESKEFNKINEFSKVTTILLRSLQAKIYSKNPVYYFIKTLHFLHVYIKHLPRLSLQLILGGNASVFSKLVIQINLFLGQFTYPSTVNSLLFLDTLKSKYNPLCDSGIIASLLYEYLKLSNFIIKELYFFKLTTEESSLDSKICTKFITWFSKISPLRLLIASYGLNEFEYDRDNPQVQIKYEDDFYTKCVMKTISTSLFPPPPAYELRIMLLEFLEFAIKLSSLDCPLDNKCLWMIKTPLCKVKNGKVKISDRLLVRTKINFKSNLSQLIMFSISLIDADALTINCNSMRYFYGQYYLSLPSSISEQDGTISTLSLGSRLTTDPKLTSLIVFKMHMISLNILSHFDQIPIHSINNKVYDRLVNLAWYYGTAFPDKYAFLESDIEFKSCCGGSEDCLKCEYISTYDPVSSVKILAQSINEVVKNNPHVIKPDFIHLDMIKTTSENEHATLQDRIEYSVDNDFWIINNNICRSYIAPTIRIKTGSEITYKTPKIVPCRCNVYCIYNRHIYNNISWICSKPISMSHDQRKKLIIKSLEIMLQSRDRGKNTPLFGGFNIAKLISKRSKFLLKSLISIYNEMDLKVESSLDDYSLLLYSGALSQIL